MSPFYCLETLTDVGAHQIGETAELLRQLRKEGQPLPSSWVLPAECFEQAIQRMISREPLYSDWPHLLWQHGNTAGYSMQHFAKRLRRPLLNLPLNLPLSDLLAKTTSPVVRLLPSLWLGENISAAAFSHTLKAPYCWATPETLEAAIRQVWLSVLSAKSLAFWQHWQASQAYSPTDFPSSVRVAIVVQTVEAAELSGTLVVRAGQVSIAAVQGLLAAIAESYPQTYEGSLPARPHFNWRSGYQAQIFYPRSPETVASTHSIESCLGSQRRVQSGIQISRAVEGHLWRFARWLQAWTEKPLHIEWCLSSEQSSLRVLRAEYWPLRPFETKMAAPPPDLSTGIMGHGAAPGNSQGYALILDPNSPLPRTAQHHIVIAREVFPEWLPLLKTAVGIVSEQGGLTCHAAVMARELGLPAVVGVAGATERFHSGDALVIDGDRGLISPLNDLETPEVDQAKVSPVKVVPCRTQVWLNLSQPDAAALLANLPLAGVGLLRSEWLMMPVLERQHPYHWVASGRAEELLERLTAQVHPILEAFAPRPVRYRSLDIRTNEFAQLRGAPSVEPNPMLGVRGTFSYQHQSAFFELELELIKRLQAQGYGNIQLILPFVRTVEEVTYCRSRVQAIGLDQSAPFALWMMAEVPSVLFLLPQYVEAGIQGIAIGTHDLTQLILGVDRDQSLFSSPYNEAHPAVQAAISQLIQSARQLNIDCCLCGISPTLHPESVTFAMQHQVPNLSVDASSLEITTRLIQQLEAQQQAAHE